MTRVISIIGTDWSGPEPQWRRQPFLDGGRLHFDRMREDDWRNLFLELGIMARFHGIAIGMRGAEDTSAMACLPVARKAYDAFRREDLYTPTLMLFVDTVGLLSLSQVAGDGPYDFGNTKHVEWGYSRFVKFFVDHFTGCEWERSRHGRLLILWWGIEKVSSNPGPDFLNQHLAQRLLDHVSAQVPGGADHVVDHTWAKFVPNLNAYGMHNWHDPWTKPPKPWTIRAHDGVTTAVIVPSFYDIVNPNGGPEVLEAGFAAMRAHRPPVDLVIVESGTNFVEAAEIMRNDAGDARKINAVAKFVASIDPVEPPKPTPPYVPTGEHMIALTEIKKEDYKLYEDLVPGNAPDTWALIIGAATEADKNLPGYAPGRKKMYSLQADGSDGYRFYDPTAATEANRNAAGKPGTWESGRLSANATKLKFRTGDHAKMWWIERDV